MAQLGQDRRFVPGDPTPVATRHQHRFDRDQPVEPTVQRLEDVAETTIAEPAA